MLKSILEGVVVDWIKEHISKVLFILPSSIAAYLYDNKYWIIACIFFVSLSTYLFWEHRKCKKALDINNLIVKQFESAGIHAILETNHQSTIQALKQAQSKFYFLGVSAKSTAYNAELPTQLERLRNSHYDHEIRFLIMDPTDSLSITARAMDENDNPNSWTHDMKSAIGRLQTIATQKSVKIQIRLFKGAYPLWRMVIIDNQSIYLNYALQAKRINQSPLIHLKLDCDSLANTLLKYYEQLWDSSITVETWLKSNTLD